MPVDILRLADILLNDSSIPYLCHTMDNIVRGVLYYPWPYHSPAKIYRVGSFSTGLSRHDGTQFEIPTKIAPALRGQIIRRTRNGVRVVQTELQSAVLGHHSVTRGPPRRASAYEISKWDSLFSQRYRGTRFMWRLRHLLNIHK